MNVYRVDFGGGRKSECFWVEAEDLAAAHAIAKKRIMKRGRRVQFRIMADRRPPRFAGSPSLVLIREASA